jgi:ABC-2 type transport system ATP-binding protein
VVGVETRNNQARIDVDPRHSDPPMIAKKLMVAGHWLTRLEEEKVNLETAFMRLRKGLVQ